MDIFWILLIFLIVQRLAELVVAKRYALRAFEDGGYEVGRGHYKWMTGTHVLFFLGFLIEVAGYRGGTGTWFPFWFGVFVTAQIGRYWIITTLGRYWNTRIIVVPGMKRVRTGPYRYLRHPNYLIVVVELLAVPLMFDAYVTAAGAAILNALVLRVRIRAENQALTHMERQKHCVQEVAT